MKHVRRISRSHSRPAMAANLLEKEHYLDLFGRFVDVVGTIATISQDCIQFKADMSTPE